MPTAPSCLSVIDLQRDFPEYAEVDTLVQQAGDAPAITVSFSDRNTQISTEVLRTLQREYTSAFAKYPMAAPASLQIVPDDDPAPASVLPPETKGKARVMAVSTALLDHLILTEETDAPQRGLYTPSLLRAAFEHEFAHEQANMTPAQDREEDICLEKAVDHIAVLAGTDPCQLAAALYAYEEARPEKFLPFEAQKEHFQHGISERTMALNDTARKQGKSCGK